VLHPGLVIRTAVQIVRISRLTVHASLPLSQLAPLLRGPSYSQTFLLSLVIDPCIYLRYSFVRSSILWHYRLLTINSIVRLFNRLHEHDGYEQRASMSDRPPSTRWSSRGKTRSWLWTTKGPLTICLLIWWKALRVSYLDGTIGGKIRGGHGRRWGVSTVSIRL